MSSQIRMSGMISGLDTESIIQQLVSAKSTKVNTLKSEQTKLSWKQEIWKDFNSKLKTMVNGSLANLRFSDAYTKKTTEVSDSTKVSVITGDSAMNTVQSLQIDKMASSGYLTGAKLPVTGSTSVTSGTKLSDLGITTGSKFNLALGSGKSTEIEITDGMTINGLVARLQESGVEANYDSTNSRIFIGSKTSGKNSNFELTASTSEGWDALKNLGLLYSDSADSVKSIADLASDTSARTDAISAKETAIKADYQAQIDSLTAANTALDTKIADEASAYNEKYGTITNDDGSTTSVDITNDSDRASRKATLNTTISNLQSNIDALNEKVNNGETLTDEESSNLEKYNTELEAAQTELDAITAYETDIQTKSDNETSITELNAKLGDADQITADATAYVDAQAAAAQTLYDSMTGASESDSVSLATRIKGEDAHIILNNADFYSSTNTVTVNGLTLSLKATTGDEKISLTTKQDTSGIYDTIKSFIKEYSEIINQMDKLYNADSASGYDVLTDDEKENMTDTEIEKWETTIKDSLLRRDSTLNTASNAMIEIMADGYTVNGKTMHLSDFGINTLNYFLSADNEKHAYHINGDSDDDDVSTETNTLQNKIETDPDSVISFFTQLSQTLYKKMNDLMASGTYSSYATLYDDKKMASEYSDYKTKISEAEEKLNDYEDKWYSKFSSMETALAKLQSNSSAVTSLLGS